jgi:WD40-like Beta Propeller Repeat
LRYRLFFLALIFIFSYEAKSSPADWEVRQLTSCEYGKVQTPHISPDGKTIYFISNCDFANKNTDRSFEIFKWEADTFTQLTDEEYCKISYLKVSPDNQKFAFTTNCLLSGKNTNRATELAVMDEDGKIEVLTQSTGYTSKNPSWSSDSNWIVFESGNNIGMNPDNSQEVFYVNIEDKEVVQRSLTIAPEKCEQPAMTENRIVSLCNEDLVGLEDPENIDRFTVKFYEDEVIGNPDKNFELFFLNIDGGVEQVTKTRKCQITKLAVHPLGRGLALVSDCGLTNESKMEKGWKLYYYAGSFIHLCPGIEFKVSSMGWSRDGKKLAVSSNYFSHGSNKERNREIFLVDIENPTKPPEVVTDYESGSSFSPALNMDGTVLVFISNNDKTEENRDRSYELFMARKKPPED